MDIIFGSGWFRGEREMIWRSNSFKLVQTFRNGGVAKGGATIAPKKQKMKGENDR